MEKNRTGNSVRPGGARYFDAAGMDQYGLNSDAPFSGSSGTYNPQSKSADPINYDGLNYSNDRMLGYKGIPDSGNQSVYGKDSLNYDATVDSKVKGYRRTEVGEVSPNEHGD